MPYHDFRSPLPGRRVRASTYARDGSDADFVLLRPGQTWAALFDGPGEVQHLWVSVVPLEPGPWLNTVRVLAWFDQETYPQIDCPLGDLFAQGHGTINTLASLAFDATATPAGTTPGLGPLGAFNFWLPMPFAQGARFEFRNTGGLPLQLRVYLDAIMQPALPDPLYYCHATFFERAAPSGTDDWEENGVHLNTNGEDNYPILDVAAGEGTYLGTSLSVTSAPGTEGDWTEGDDMIFIDGQSWPPALHGTGTEDYFGLANGLSAVVQTPHYGVSHHAPDPSPLARPHDGRFTLYRLHLADPIPFHRSIKVTLEHGHNNRCQAHYKSVAYWYGRGHDDHLPPVQIDSKALFGNPGADNQA